MHKSVISTFEGIELLKAHVVSFFSYIYVTNVPRTFDLHCSS